jgi:hypothetical protein
MFVIATAFVLFGLFFFTFAIVLETNNFRSALMFKAIPAIAGLFQFFVGVGMFMNLVRVTV